MYLYYKGFITQANLTNDRVKIKWTKYDNTFFKLILEVSYYFCVIKILMINVEFYFIV